MQWTREEKYEKRKGKQDKKKNTKIRERDGSVGDQSEKEQKLK